MFDNLIGNEENKELFKRLIKNERIPHSLLLTGNDGIGKKQFAIEIAKSFVCQNPNKSLACSNCSGCKRASKLDLPKSDDRDAHTKVVFTEHPDVGMVIPYRNNILVDAIRELEEAANFLPYEANARIFLIDNADKMNASATNALLKTLEEPAETTYIFLITSRPSSLLQTIISRCQIIRFAPIKTSEIEDHLMKTKKYLPEDAKLLAKISRGSIAVTKNINMEEYYVKRTKMLDALRSLSNKRNFSILLKTSEELSDPKNKEFYEENLKILQTLIHDIWKLQNNNEAKIINSDILQNIQHLAENTEKKRVSKWLMEIETLLENLKSNLNRKVATDALFMEMAS